jgi:hypothetical protein
MADIHLNQSLTLALNTSQDLIGATVNIIARKPDGTILTWVGAVAGTTKVQYLIPSGILNAVGQWVVYSSVIFLGGRKATGDAVAFNVRSLLYNYE